MAKKKPPGDRSPRNKEREDIERFRMIELRVSVAYAGWLARAAKHDRASVSSFLGRAATDRAKANGFEEPPPDRLS